MPFKVVLCVFAVLGQSFAGPSNCGCSQDFSSPVYSTDGVAISEIDYQPSYKPISINFSEKDAQSSYKPISVRVEKESYQPNYKPTYISSSEKEIYKYSSKPYVSVSEKPRYKPVSGRSYEKDSYQYNQPISVIDVPNNGGTFFVTSVCPIAPSGVGVASDLSLGGELEVSGVVPYLSAVAFEGQFDANGAAAVEYGCGDCVAITEEIRGNPGFTPFVSGKN
ncbi:uncharacterized protein LOC134752720 [Cydia strobilella]|uniref:uncharacterized protein LOC134752720 n=1 Tax=Cydia strobilella TaxID=1100964 RepID=UPI0030053271